MQSNTFAREAYAAARINQAISPDPMPDLSALLTDAAVVASEFIPKMDKRFLGARALASLPPSSVCVCV